MNYHFQAHLQIRKNLLDILNTTSMEDLVHIPDGFNNNIYWNLAHCVATQQLLHYYLSENQLRVEPSFVERYKKGTLPTLEISPLEVEQLGFLLTETAKLLVRDFDNDFFEDYIPYTTSFGLDLKNIQDAIIFNNIHESLHYGYVMALKRALLGE